MIHAQGPGMLFGPKIVRCSREETFGSLISTSSFQRQEWKASTQDNKHRRQEQLAFSFKVYIFRD